MERHGKLAVALGIHLHDAGVFTLRTHGKARIAGAVHKEPVLIRHKVERHGRIGFALLLCIPVDAVDVHGLAALV